MASPRQVSIALLEKENIKITNEIRELTFNDLSNKNVKRIELTPGSACVAVPFYSVTDLKHSKPEKMLRIWYQENPPSQKYCDAISSYFERTSLDYFVKFHFCEEVLSVKGTILSGAIMDYVEGQDLIDYLAECVKLPLCRVMLDDLANKFRKMSEDLKNTMISHGDLSGTNMRVLNNGDIRLIDYDSICIPQLVGIGYSTSGTDGYNHRQRKGIRMQLNADFFPEIVIYATIIILREDPQLWSKYIQDQGKNDGGILFTKPMLEDVNCLKNSKLYDDILLLAKRNDEISQTLNILIQSIQGEINDVPFLFDKLPYVKYVYAHYCGLCGHHFGKQTEKYCPICGRKRETK